MPLTPGKHYPGTTLRLYGEFSNDIDTLLDPNVSIIFKLMSPLGYESTYTYLTDAELQKDATGVYFCDVTPDAPGRWFYQWVVQDGALPTTLVGQGDFLVQDTPFYQGYGRAYSS